MLGTLPIRLFLKATISVGGRREIERTESQEGSGVAGGAFSRVTPKKSRGAQRCQAKPTWNSKQNSSLLVWPLFRKFKDKEPCASVLTESTEGRNYPPPPAFSPQWNQRKVTLTPNPPGLCKRQGLEIIAVSVFLKKKFLF